MIIYGGEKMTANQVAKTIIFERGMHISHTEDCLLNLEKLTEKENRDIEKCLDNQTERVKKFLGL